MTTIRKITAVHGRDRMARARQNLEEGQAFLEENGKREDVIVLPSGLQYRIIEEGFGASPGPMDRVTVHYCGTLIDGTQFDSSYGRQPLSFQVSGVILGWYEALQLMKEGAKWELFIPPDLAYGREGAGARIGPNSTLIFEVQLIAVEGI